MLFAGYAPSPIHTKDIQSLVISTSENTFKPLCKFICKSEDPTIKTEV